MEDLPELTTRLTDVAYAWNSIGVQLDFKPGPLANITAMSFGNPIAALQQLLTKWLQRTDPPPTLEDLAKAIGGPVIGNQVLAKSLLDNRAELPSVKAGGKLNLVVLSHRVSITSLLDSMPVGTSPTATVPSSGASGQNADAELGKFEMWIANGETNCKVFICILSAELNVYGGNEPTKPR